MAEVSIDGAHMAVTVNAGLRGRVWVKLHEVEDGVAEDLTFYLSGEVAKGIADTIESRGEMTAQGASCFAMHPDEAISVTIGKVSIWMGADEADDLAESIRKALAWKEAHP
jgi:hypothetical protein